MKYCKKCVMPDTRPYTKFNEEGVCPACQNWEKRSEVDWEERWKELEELCDNHRGCNENSYDCAIAASGGKDSHFQVYIIKELMCMNPVLLSTNGFSWTQTGMKNLNNISEEFGVDIISLNLNRKALKTMMKKALIRFGYPTWFYDAAIYAFPYKMAMKLGVKLLFYGENVNYEYGGKQDSEDSPDALKQWENDVVKPIDFQEWCGDGITLKELEIVRFPNFSEMKEFGLQPRYLSYYLPWDSQKSYEVAQRHGFRHLGHEHIREGTIEQYNQIDCLGYLVNQWFKYPKFGHASATEMASRWIRAGYITRQEGIQYVKKYDSILDQDILDDFCQFVGITNREFWEMADKWYDPDLFYQDKFGIWHEKKEEFNKIYQDDNDYSKTEDRALITPIDHP